MKTLNNYIIEKYRISKDIKLKLNIRKDSEEIIKYIKARVKEEELDLSDVFRNKKFDSDGNTIETLYYEGSVFSYSYYKDYERGKPIDSLFDLFSGNDIQKIYDYLFSHEEA